MRMLFCVCALFVLAMCSLFNLALHMKKGDVKALDFAQASITTISYIGVAYFWYATM